MKHFTIELLVDVEDFRKAAEVAMWIIKRVPAVNKVMKIEQVVTKKDEA